MALAEVERDIARTVVHRFLRLGEPTPRKLLVIRFKAPESLDLMVRHSILRPTNREAFLPKVLAFHYCGDSDALRIARTSVEIVLHVLQNMFEVELDKTEFTHADVEAHARKMYDIIEPETIRLGLYLVQEFGVLRTWGGNPEETEVISLRIGETVVTIRNIETSWDDHVRQYGANVELGLGSDAVALAQRGAPGMENPKAASLGNTESLSVQKEGILVLISHSSKDANLARALVELLRAGLNLPSHRIRCSSVDGHRLPAGVDTEKQLREEVNFAGALIGLITPNSLASPYVLFELGARWGAGLSMIPLLAGVGPDALRGPLSGLNALSCSHNAQLLQLIEDLGKSLNIPPQSTASYYRYVSTLKEMSDAVSPNSLHPATTVMNFEESVYWKPKESGRDGPYCPTCYDDKQKEIHLTPGATRGTFTCGVCRNSFHTNEYNPAPVRRRVISRGIKGID